MPNPSLCAQVVWSLDTFVFFLFGGVLLICVSMLFFLFSCCSCQPDSTSDWNNSMIAIMYAHWKGNRLLISHLHTSTYMDTDMFDEFIYCGNDIILNIRILGLLVLQHPHHGCGCYLPKTTSTDGCLTSQCKVKFVKTCYWNYPSIYQLYQLLSFRPVGTRIPTNIFTTCWLVWTTPPTSSRSPGSVGGFHPWGSTEAIAYAIAQHSGGHLNCAVTFSCHDLQGVDGLKGWIYGHPMRQAPGLPPCDRRGVCIVPLVPSLPPQHHAGVVRHSWMCSSWNVLLPGSLPIYIKMVQTFCEVSSEFSNL